MAIEAAKLIVSVGADISDLESGFKSAERDMNSLSGTIGGAGAPFSAFGEIATGALRHIGADIVNLATTGITQLTSGISNIATSSVSLAGDFQSSMSQVTGLAGESKDAIAGLSDKVLDMSGKVGKPPKELADALFFVESAGIHGDSAMKVLTASAQASAAGLGETKNVADAVTSALNAYGMGADQATHITDELVTAVAAGKMDPATLASNLGKVLPAAASLKVPLSEVGASIATLTRAGLSVPQATTAINSVFTSMIKPSASAQAALGGIGLSATKLRDYLGQNGLAATLQMLMEKTGGSVDAMAKIFPNANALKEVLGTIGTQSAAYKDILDQMNHSQDATSKAFATATDTYNFQTRSLGDTFSAIGVGIGNLFLPSLTKLISDGIVPAANRFLTLAGELDKNHTISNLLMGTVNTIIPVLTSAAKSVADWIGAFADAPNKIGFVETSLSSLSPWIKGLIDGVHMVADGFRQGGLLGALGGFGEFVKSEIPAVQGVFSGLFGWVEANWPQWKAKLGEWGSELWGWMQREGPVLWQKAKDTFGQLSDWVQQEWPGWKAHLETWGGEALNWIEGVAKEAPGKITNFLVGIINKAGENLPGWINKLADFGIAALDWITGAGTQAPGKTNDYVGKITDALGKNVPKIVDALKSFGSKFGTWIEEHGPDILKNLDSYIGTVANAVLSHVPDVIGWFTGYVNNFTDWLNSPDPKPGTGQFTSKILQAITDNLPKIASAGAGLAWALVDGLIPAAITYVGKRWPEWVASFFGYIVDLSNQARSDGTIGAALIDGIRGGISGAWNAFTGFLSGQWTLLVNQVKRDLGIASPSTVFAQIGHFLIDGLWNGIAQWGDMGGKIYDWFDQNIVHKMQGLLNTFPDVGKNIVGGIFTGIQNAWGSAGGNFTTLINSLPQFVRDALGIHSPSRVFADLAQFIPQGIAVGVQQGTPVAQKAIADMGAALPKSLPASLPLPASASGGAIAGSGATPIIVNLTVQGHVQTDRDLVNFVQNELLKLGLQRGGSLFGGRIST